MSDMTDAEEMELLLAQEDRLQFTRFGNDTALDLGLALLNRARTQGLGVAIDVRRNGLCLFRALTTGATADNEGWVDRKVRAVDRFGHSSLYLGALGRAKGTSLEEVYQLAPKTYAFAGGCFPILLRGTGPIGTVTVSGLPQRDDHALVVWALEQVLV